MTKLKSLVPTQTKRPTCKLCGQSGALEGCPGTGVRSVPRDRGADGRGPIHTAQGVPRRFQAEHVGAGANGGAVCGSHVRGEIAHETAFA